MGKPHKELAQFLIAGAEEANASGNETALVKVRCAFDLWSRSSNALSDGVLQNSTAEGSLRAGPGEEDQGADGDARDLRGTGNGPRHRRGDQGEGPAHGDGALLLQLRACRGPCITLKGARAGMTSRKCVEPSFFRPPRGIRCVLYKLTNKDITTSRGSAATAPRPACCPGWPHCHAASCPPRCRPCGRPPRDTRDWAQSPAGCPEGTRPR